MSATFEYSHILYHGNCYDGFGAALCVWVAQEGRGEYLPCIYGQEPPALPPEATVLMVDFSYPRPMLERMNAEVAQLYILDHHKTAQAALEGLPYAEFDLTESGATLAFRHFFRFGGGPLALWPFVQYLRDRDLWLFELPGSKEISAALRAYPFDFKVWYGLVERLDRLAEEGIAVLRHTEQMVQVMCEQAVWQDVGGYAVPVVNATVFFSEVGDALCHKFPDAPFAAYYLDRADGNRQWGLRSRGGFDTSAVAKAYGGGGHPGASGFVQPVPPVLAL